MKLASENLAAAIAASLERRPGHYALDGLDTPLTADEFLSCAEVRRRQLSKAGIEAGANVYVASGRGGQYWVDLLAVWAAGATAVPFDPNLTADAAANLFRKVVPDAILATAPLPSLPERTIQLACPPVSAARTNLQVREANGPAAVLFTSGSTGQPKGVVLQHAALLGNARATLAKIDLEWRDRLLVATPYTFTSAICHFLAAGLSGATLIAYENRLFKADLGHAIEESRATCFGGAPLQAHWIGELAETRRPDLRWIMSSGDHLRENTISLLMRTMPGRGIYTFYGLTEAGGRFCMLPSSALPEAAGAVGAPIDGMAVSVRDEDGRELAPREEGEIFASGDYLFDGYYGDLASTQATLTRHGLRTGDLGYVGEDGWLRVTGRVDDVFKCSGQKVSSVKIVDALMQIGVFDDVAIVPRQHPMHGHVPWAVYVLRRGKEFDKRAVLQALRLTLPAYHLPREFLAVSHIPRTGSGKVARRLLREMLESH